MGIRVEMVVVVDGISGCFDVDTSRYVLAVGEYDALEDLSEEGY